MLGLDLVGLEEDDVAAGTPCAHMCRLDRPITENMTRTTSRYFIFMRLEDSFDWDGCTHCTRYCTFAHHHLMFLVLVNSKMTDFQINISASATKCENRSRVA